MFLERYPLFLEKGRQEFFMAVCPKQHAKQTLFNVSALLQQKAHSLTH